MKNLMHDVHAGICKGETQQRWIRNSTWAQLLQVWDGEKFKSLSQTNKKNRASTFDGKGYLRHTGGSISYLEYRRKLVCIYKLCFILSHPLVCYFFYFLIL
ncbi:hypothetical protein ACH5RR_039250 [Cinchona calisaya]|uniref:Uncharacterized protein n=1 Tax=Cinchona calisaya TaxID=153742 RepID=A0ABD2XXP4_9GENT